MATGRKPFTVQTLKRTTLKTNNKHTILATILQLFDLVCKSRKHAHTVRCVLNILLFYFLSFEKDH